MKEQMVFGIDLAKSVFQIHGMDTRGKAIVRKRLYRADLKRYFSNKPKAIVAMEACSGSNYWGRVFREMGHEVRLISPQFVKPYVKSNKNDMADAEAIAEAATRPGMRFVAVKEVGQQDVMLIHRVRERLVSNRTALMNEIRSFLHEYGIVFPKGERHLKTGLLKLFGDDCPGLSNDTGNEIMELYKELVCLDERIGRLDLKIKGLYQGSEVCRRLGTIPGIGPVSATAIMASMGDPHAFRNGREFAAFLGLVPRQCSSGGKSKLLGISKRGDKYLRKLLVHGARNLVRYADDKSDRASRWLIRKIETRGFNKATVAVANKNARICWSIMRYGASYRADNRHIH